MALIRKVIENLKTGKWAYIEYSDENTDHFIVLGNKEFDTEGEVSEWKKGFALDSYEWKDPKENVIDQMKTVPIGIMPKKIWLENRLLEIKSAIKRYLDVNLCVPTEWNEEYNSLIEQLNNEYHTS